MDLHPEDAAALKESARLIEEGLYCQAHPLLVELAEDLPAHADVFNMLGYTHRKMGELDESALNYERALYLKPNHPGALEYQGELFLMQGNLSGALANLARLEETCDGVCPERDELRNAIREWQTR